MSALVWPTSLYWIHIIIHCLFVSCLWAFLVCRCKYLERVQGSVSKQTYLAYFYSFPTIQICILISLLSLLDFYAKTKRKTKSAWNCLKICACDNKAEDRTKMRHRPNNDRYLAASNMTKDRMKMSRTCKNRQLTDNGIKHVYQQSIVLPASLLLYVQWFSAANMTVLCPYCSSLSFYKEHLNCHHNVKVNIATSFSSQLWKIFTEDFERTSVKTFAFSFSSFSANLQSLPGKDPHVSLYSANDAFLPVSTSATSISSREVNEFWGRTQRTGAGITGTMTEIMS